MHDLRRRSPRRGRHSSRGVTVVPSRLEQILRDVLVEKQVKFDFSGALAKGLARGKALFNGVEHAETLNKVESCSKCGMDLADDKREGRKSSSKTMCFECALDAKMDNPKDLENSLKDTSGLERGNKIFSNSSGTLYVCNEDSCDFETRDSYKARAHEEDFGHDVVETNDESYARKNADKLDVCSCGTKWPSDNKSYKCAECGDSRYGSASKKYPDNQEAAAALKKSLARKSDFENAAAMIDCPGTCGGCALQYDRMSKKYYCQTDACDCDTCMKGITEDKGLKNSAASEDKKRRFSEAEKIRQEADGMGEQVTTLRKQANDLLRKGDVDGSEKLMVQSDALLKKLNDLHEKALDLRQGIQNSYRGGGDPLGHNGPLDENTKIKCPDCGTVQTWGALLSYGACKKKSCNFQVTDESVGMGLPRANSSDGICAACRHADTGHRPGVACHGDGKSNCQCEGYQAIKNDTGVHSNKTCPKCKKGKLIDLGGSLYQCSECAFEVYANELKKVGRGVEVKDWAKENSDGRCVCGHGTGAHAAASGRGGSLGACTQKNCECKKYALNRENSGQFGQHTTSSESEFEFTHADTGEKETVWAKNEEEAWKKLSEEFATSIPDCKEFLKVRKILNASENRNGHIGTCECEASKCHPEANCQLDPNAKNKTVAGTTLCDACWTKLPNEYKNAVSHTWDNLSSSERQALLKKAVEALDWAEYSFADLPPKVRNKVMDSRLENSKQDDDLGAVSEIIRSVNLHAASSLNTWELSPEDYKKVQSKLSKFKKLSVDNYGDLVGIVYVLKNANPLAICECGHSQSDHDSAVGPCSKCSCGKNLVENSDGITPTSQVDFEQIFTDLSDAMKFIESVKRSGRRCSFSSQHGITTIKVFKNELDNRTAPHDCELCGGGNTPDTGSLVPMKDAEENIWFVCRQCAKDPAQELHNKENSADHDCAEGCKNYPKSDWCDTCVAHDAEQKRRRTPEGRREDYRRRKDNASPQVLRRELEESERELKELLKSPTEYKYDIADYKESIASLKRWLKVAEESKNSEDAEEYPHDVLPNSSGIARGQFKYGTLSNGDEPVVGQDYKSNRPGYTEGRTWRCGRIVGQQVEMGCVERSGTIMTTKAKFASEFTKV